MQMLKSYKSSLNLNSYKLDTRGYQEKIKELIEQNADVKFSLRESKAKENQLFEELKSTKLEVTTLRNMLKSEYVVHQSKCKNCATYSKQSIDRLVSDLDAERTKMNEFRKMYENEVENKKQLTEYYEKKFHNILRDKDILVKKYEEKIKYLSNQNVTHSQQSIDSSTSIQNHLLPVRRTQQDVSAFPERQAEKERKKYPPPPPPPKSNSPRPNAFQSQKQLNNSSISEDSISNLVGPIIDRLSKMQISFDEMRTIPQVQRFTQTSNPPKNRFIKLLRDFPFECEDDDLIEQSYKHIMQYLQYNQMENNGENIINFLTTKMENA